MFPATLLASHSLAQLAGPFGLECSFLLVVVFGHIFSFRRRKAKTMMNHCIGYTSGSISEKRGMRLMSVCAACEVISFVLEDLCEDTENNIFYNSDCSKFAWKPSIMA